MKLIYSLTWAITIFITLTIGYGILKIYFGPENPDVKNNNSAGIVLLMYMIITFITQLVTNFSNVKLICEGSPQPFYKIFLYTLLPYFFIFGTIVLMINIKKGWLNPFSNTLGYLIAMKIMSGNKSFNTMLNHFKKDSGKQQQLIDTICQDKSLITNELSAENYKEMIDIIRGNGTTKITQEGGAKGSEVKDENDGHQLPPEDSPTPSTPKGNVGPQDKDTGGDSLPSTPDGDTGGDSLPSTPDGDTGGEDEYTKAYNSLFRMVLLKDIIAECVWFLLAGFLAISIQSNIITSVECDYDPATITKQKEEADKKRRENKKPEIKYTKET